ncbi:MAG: thymidine phosphorylase [Acidimicrobiia bacterium]|nr:thymidine phosphorylase [Acidimicrobiia bacterium]
MTAVELIEKKRHGLGLTSNEIRWLISAYTDGTVTDYQMAAMLMAIFIHGLNHEELAVWTDAMLHSGEVLDFSDVDAPVLDKHSTGGVGDKVSIPLAPMVAACGVAIPMMSGRGLGHTGGTLDKLESIPGFTTALDPERFNQILRSTGLVLAGQSETLVPADRKLYALRDSTGTVPSIPLISSSIMSKKLAEDLDGLVLDVKVGKGAFMRDLDSARQLAETMVGIGAAHDTKVAALLTAMDQPLGDEVGNASEIRESIDVLRGEGPADVTEITMALGVEMLLLGGITGDEQSARNLLAKTVETGSALALFERVIVEQGGNPEVLTNPALLPIAPLRFEVKARQAGIVSECDALSIGVAAMRLGAGRERKEDTIDPGVGITVHAKIGDRVEVDQPLATLAYATEDRLQSALPLLDAAWIIGEAGAPGPLIIDRIGP